LRADRFTILLDANAIYGALSANILLSLAEAGLFRPRWSAQILEEFERNLAKNLKERGTDPEAAKRKRTSMEQAFPEACVEGFEPLIDGIVLPDPDDRHVVAAAVQTKAAVIVTENLKDFPADVLENLEIEVLTVDEFVADLLDLSGPEGIAALKKMRERFQNPAINAEALVNLIEQRGLAQTADMMRRYVGLL
jgi:predicted nucleic acid-binding protein